MDGSELADIIVDSLAGDDEDGEEIFELENVVDLIFVHYRNCIQVCIHIKCMCTFAVLEY